MANFSDPIEVPMSDSFKGQTVNLTVDVKVLRDWRFRIAFSLMRFAGWIMGASVKAAAFRPRTIIRLPGGHWHFFDNATTAARFQRECLAPVQEASNVTDCVWHTGDVEIDG